MGNQGKPGNQPSASHYDGPAGGTVLRDADAFAHATREGYGAIYLTALSIVRDPDIAQDVTQETYLRAWLKIDTLRDSALIQPWLGRIVRNLAVQWMRTGQKRSRLVPLIPMEEITVEPADINNPNPRQAAGQTEQHNQLTDAVMALPEDLRQAVLLHYAEGMSPSDIARLNGEAPSTVARRLDKAREQLRTQLESGLSAGLAMLKSRPRNLQRTLGVLAAVATIPATSRAQLLQLAADTPPPPMVDPVTSAATAAPTGETSIMKSIIAKLGATKLLTGIAAAAVIGGGAYSVSSLTKKPQRSAESSEQVEQTSRFDRNRSVGNQTVASATSKHSTSSDSTNSRTGVATNPTSITANRNRVSPAERISKLQSEQVTTSPELIIEDGETSGNVHFNLQVVDAAGIPVKGATIEPTGVRMLVESAGWYGWGLDAPKWPTNEQGIARAYVRQYTTEKLETGGITFTTSHPDYTPVQSDMALTSITKVVLTPGNTLDVIASDEKSSSPITSGITVEPYGGPESSVDWNQRNDGTITIRRIGEKDLKFYLKQTDASGNVFVSDYQVVEFPRASDGPLYVTMHPTYTIRGRLSENVPRPVANGKVAAHTLSGRHNCGDYASMEVDVASDGTFELKEFPKGTVQIWALTDGYCSVSNIALSPYELAQRFELRENNPEYILPMEPSASVRLTLVDSDGNPARGAIVHASPNICREGCCGIWFNRTFQATSDDAGVAILKNHPPEKKARISVHGTWELKPRPHPFDPDRLSRDVNLELKPGEVMNETLTVYPKGTFTISASGDKMTTNSLP